MVDEKFLTRCDDELGDLFYEIGFDSTGVSKGKNNRTIYWDFWLGLSQWTKEQAVYLLCGIDPNDADFEKIPSIIRDMQQKAFDGLKVEIAPPFVWLRQFNDNGMLELCHTSKELSIWYNEQLTEKELAGDLPLDDSLLSSVVNLSLPKQGRREKQLAAILGVIKQLELAQMKIPEGEKKTIESVCREQDKPAQLLFGVDGSTCFENAWKVGRKQKLFEMENNDIYAKRGK